MKKLTILSVILLLAVTTGLAQKSDYPRSLNVRAALGYGTMDVSKLHNFLPAGVHDFGNDQFLLGLNAQRIFRHFVIGISAYGIFGDQVKGDTFTYNVNGGGVTLDMGYAVVNKQTLQIFPMLGVGPGSYGMDIHKNANSTLPIEDIVKSPAREISISKTAALADLSLNINWVPAYMPVPGENVFEGVSLGLKVGYMYGVSSSQWDVQNQKVTGAPAFGLNMFYVKLLVGGVRFHKEG